jgi:hypothetical protein
MGAYASHKLGGRVKLALENRAHPLP